MKITQKLSLHLNRGKEHDSHFTIEADGRPTKVTRHVCVRMKGYKTIADEFHFGDETFDALTGTEADMLAWVEARVIHAVG